MGKLGKHILVLALIAFAGTVARADEAVWKPFVSFDYFGVGNLSKHNGDTARGICSSIIAAGATTCAYTVTSYGGYGGRVGAMKDFGGVSLGPSFGYFYGGPTTGKGVFNATPSGTLTTQQTNNTFRFLGEARQQYPLRGDWAAAANVGLGMAIVKESDSCSSSGSLAGVCGSNDNPTWGFATWELGPSLLYRSWELALRYAGFARGGQLPWNTLDVSFGYRW